MVALAVATGCSSDEPVAEPTPTVPTVAPTTGPAAGEEGVDASPDTGVDDSLAPDARPSDVTADGPGDTAPPVSDDEPSHLVPTTTEPAPTGDLGAVQVRLEEIAVLEEPLAMTTVPGDSHLWIAGRQGQVVRLDPATGEVVDVILDLGGDTVGRREQGLLGIAADETHLYVDYTNLDGDTRVDAYALTDGGVDPGSRRELISQEQPFGNHNGGGLVIDEEGYLYIGLGDGGSAGDPLGAGQDPFTWLGSILRIAPTPDRVQPYGIPPGNPFADGTDGLPEIFLTGVRNPWRFSLDRVTGDLWVGDVGQDSYEEITLLLAANGGGAGSNLGWSLREGLHEFHGPAPEGHIEPVWEYGHDDGVSVTGGYVYRGPAIPELYGNYVFGDYQTARLWALDVSTGEVVFRDLDVPVPGGNLASFGEGPDGELYVLSLAGPVSRVVPGP